jgi:hypothetical protein
MALVAVASAQLIDVHFGNVQCDTLQVDSASTIAAADLASLTVEDLTVDSTCTINSVATFGDSVHIGSIVIGDGSTLTFYDASLDAYVQFDSASNHSEFYSDMVVDSQLTVGDTLALGTSSPEYFFHVFNSGIYSVFEGDSVDSGKTYVAVSTQDSTAEVGFSLQRLDTEYWTIEDSNGTFIIYDSDDTQNAVSIADSTCDVTFYGNVGISSADLSVGDSLHVAGNMTLYGNLESDLVANTYNWAAASAVTGGADSIIIDFTPDLANTDAGAEIKFIAEAANTGRAYVQVDGGSWVEIYEATDVSQLEGGEIVNTAVTWLVNDGTHWQLMNQP